MTIVDMAVYEDGQRLAEKVPLEKLEELREAHHGFVWLGMAEPTAEEFDAVAREFNLHELAVEDAVKAHQRPKLEIYDDTLFLVLKTARYIDESEEVEFGEVMAFIGAHFVITVRHGSASPLHDVRLAVEGRPEMLRCGPSSVVHAIIDRVVDDYSPVIDGVTNDIVEVEEHVFSGRRDSPTQRIYQLKREVLEFERATRSLVNPAQKLASGAIDVVHEDLQEYFRDVADHVLRDAERVEALNEQLTSILQANLTQVTVQQNNDMRRISAWVAIIAVPTMIAGIYGMNFDHMPELRWKLGYPLALLVMASVCSVLYVYFKRIKWL
jgi:magnesium transporter